MNLNRKLSSTWLIFVYLLCFAILTLLFAANESGKQEHPEIRPGQEVRVGVRDRDIGGGYFLLYLPSDYNEVNVWPVIFYFHGAGTKPSTKLFRKNTQGRGFIIVGMENVHRVKGQMTRKKYIDYLHRELKNVMAVKDYISRYLSINEKQLFITGKSMGGWLVSALAERSAETWAGIAIFCAGRNSFVLRGRRTALRGKAVYIGTGEDDQNRPAAAQAARYYRRLGAKVTFEVYKGLGHKADAESKKLHNWLLKSNSDTDKDAKTNQTN